MLPYKKLTLVLSITAALAGCGGSDSSTEQTPPQTIGQGSGNDGSNGSDNTTTDSLDNHSVTVLGGWQNVKVFMDVNSDGIDQINEPMKMTNAQGAAELDVSDIENEDEFNLFAVVVPDISVDPSGNMTFNKSFSLKAPPLSKTISPFTSTVAELMSHEGVSQENAISQLGNKLGIASLDLEFDYSQGEHIQYQVVANALLQVMIAEAEPEARYQALVSVLDAIEQWRSEQDPIDWSSFELGFVEGRWQILDPNSSNKTSSDVTIWGEIPAPADPEANFEGYKNEQADTLILLTKKEVSGDPIAFVFNPNDQAGSLTRASDLFAEQLSSLDYPRHQKEQTLVSYKGSSEFADNDTIVISRSVKSIDLDILDSNYQEQKTSWEVDKHLDYAQQTIEIRDIELLPSGYEIPWVIAEVVYDTTPQDTTDSNFAGGYVLLRLDNDKLVVPASLSEEKFYTEYQHIFMNGLNQLKLTENDETHRWHTIDEHQATLIEQGEYSFNYKTIQATATDNTGNQTWCFESSKRTFCQFYSQNNQSWGEAFLLSPELPSGKLLRSRFISLDYNSEGTLGLLTRGWDTRTAAAQYYPQSTSWHWQEGVDFYNIHDDGAMQLDNAGNWLVKLGDNVNLVELQGGYSTVIEKTKTRLAPVLFDSGMGIYIGSSIYKTERGKIYMLKPE